MSPDWNRKVSRGGSKRSLTEPILCSVRLNEGKRDGYRKVAANPSRASEVVTLLRAALWAGDTVAGWSGTLQRPLSIERLMAAARRRMDLADFGETPVVEPLRRFLEACRKEAQLSLIGRLALKWDTVRFLANLLELAAAEARSPAIASEPIEGPIFITGFPRSGTTFLHELMLCDPANRSPLVFETIHPYPERRAARTRDGRAARVERQLRMFDRIAPEFRGLHRISAVSPQECSEITAHSFRSLRFDTTYRIPSYRTWLEADGDGHLPAYRLHKRFLQHLQHQDGAARRGQHWVLKCPDHLFALEALGVVYPDARLVFVHRDPVKVLLSVAKLTEVLRRPFTRSIDRLEIGRGESARWLEGARLMIEAGESARWAGRICHIHYLDLIADPAEAVEKVYRHFGIAYPDSLSVAIRAFATLEPNGGYGVHRYRFEEHGLDEEAERKKFQAYMVHFGVASERAGPRQVGGVGAPRDHSRRGTTSS